MTGRQYTAASNPASATLEELAAWVQRSPHELGYVAFHARRMIDKQGLPHWPTFDRVLSAGVASGVPETVARKWCFRGFLATAFHREPPPKLAEEPDP